jgi:hypothetical protein
MREIHFRTRIAGRLQEEAEDAADRLIPADLRARLSQLESSIRLLHESAAQLGEIPEGPDTFRARLGARLIRVMQRTLFWLVMPLRRQQILVAKAQEQQSIALRELTAASRQLALELEVLRRKISSGGIQS